MALVASSAACRRATSRTPPREVVAGLEQRVQGEPPSYVGRDDLGNHVWKDVQRFYKLNGYRPAWSTGRRLSHDAAELLDVVNGAPAEGLDPAAYDLAPVATLRTERSHNPFKRDSLKAQDATELDIRLTTAFLKYARHLAAGRVDPGEVDPHWFSSRSRQVDLVNLLRQALESGRIQDTLQSLVPQHPEYTALKQALARYREIAAHGGWPALPEKQALRKGSRDPQVATLRARLAAEGDLQAAAAGDEALYDAAVAEGVRRFEKRHGRKEDGILDRETIAAMNVPADARIAQLELNMERWRWLPEKLGDRHILVNIPAFELTVFDGGNPVLGMRVVTGKADSPTPIFSDEMTEVVFNPYWNIPRSILRNETLPAILRDPGYLERNNLEVVHAGKVVAPSSIDWSDDDFHYQLRQRPGAKNSLGLVKFLFPNQFDVYLHDTPADSLFARNERDFSHGCVRVEKPEELAEYVLKDQSGWTRDRIAAAMHSGREQHVALKRPIPVYILYETARADRDGTVYFLDDVYGHDAAQARLLPHAPGPPAAQVAQAN
ncbi:MAG TPA: L,D-transpeptidase family protein [Vicinamibacteria bacterium]|nr:L,D-transpeptidase family protein [Vicinamibacteria bacterium]